MNQASDKTQSATIFDGHVDSRPTSYQEIEDLRRNRDAASWEDFAKKYGPVMFRACKAMGLHGRRALEVATNVIGKVFQKLRDGHADGGPAFVAPDGDRTGSFRSWLKTTVYREMLDFLAEEAEFLPLDEE